MQLRFFTGADRSTRETMLEAELAKFKVTPLDISRHRMSSRKDMNAGIQALARGPMLGALRIVIWREASALATISPNWPEHSLLEAIAAKPHPAVMLLAEGSTVGFPPASGWSELIKQAQVLTAEDSPWYEAWDGVKRQEQVSRIARTLGVQLDHSAVLAVLRSSGSDSVAIKDLLQRSADLAAGEILTGSFVRSVSESVATTPQELVVEAIAGRPAEVAKLGAALLATGVKTMDLLLAMQRYGQQHLTIAGTQNATGDRLCRALGIRSGALYYRRREIPAYLLPRAARVLDLALAGIKKELAMPSPPALVIQQLVVAAS